MSAMKGKFGDEAKARPSGTPITGFGQKTSSSSLFGSSSSASTSGLFAPTTTSSTFGATSKESITPQMALLQLMPDPRLPATQDVDTTSGSIVAFRVGEPPNKFYVHRAVLLKSSEFLQTKAKPEWNQSESESVVSLPEHTPEAFLIYSKWLYTSGIIATSAVDNESAQVDEKSDWLNLARAYVLGEVLIDVDFKDTVIDALRAKVKSIRGLTVWDAAPDLVRIIYQGTPDSSPARRFLIDLYHGHGSPSDMETRDLFPNDFLFDFARASLSRRVTVKTPVTNLGGASVTKCNYHGHGSEKSCYTDHKR